MDNRNTGSSLFVFSAMTTEEDETRGIQVFNLNYQLDLKNPFPQSLLLKLLQGVFTWLFNWYSLNLMPMPLYGLHKQGKTIREKIDYFLSMFAAESPRADQKSLCLPLPPAKSRWVVHKPVKKKHGIDIRWFWRCKQCHFCPQGPPQSPKYQSTS